MKKLLWIIGFVTILLIGCTAVNSDSTVSENKTKPKIIPEKSNWNKNAAVGIISNRIVLPNSQTLTPAGKTTELPGMRPVTVSISPDGKLLATSGKTSKLLIFNLPATNAPHFISLPGEEDLVEKMETHEINPDKSGQISYTGLVFSPDGKRIYLSNVNGSIKVFSVAANGIVRPAGTWKLPGKAAPERNNEVPAGLAVSADGKRLYVCGSFTFTSCIWK